MLVWACALAILAAAPQHLAAQAAGRAPVLLLADLAFDGQSANAVQPDDAAVAGRATAELRRALMGAGAVTLADSAGASAAMERADQPGFHCSTNAACMRDVGQRLGATWVVTGRVSKISNLIWYLSAQLVDVTSGSVLLSESLELKGERDEMVPRGAVSMARRIVRAAGRGAATP